MTRLPALALLVVVILVGAPTAGAEAPRRLLVLGADGRPAKSVFVTYGRERHEGRPLLDEDAEGEEVVLERGVLPALDPWPGHVILWRPDAAPVALGPASTVSGVRLLPGLPLAGRLRFTAGADPKGRELLAVPVGAGGLVRRTRAAADGTFLFPRLSRGGWRLLVRRGDGRLMSLGVFPAGGTAEAEIPSGGVVDGQVLAGEASTRTPLAGARLEIVALPGGETPAGTGPEVVTDADGAWRLVDLPAGVWEMHLLDETHRLDPERPRFEVEALRDLSLPPVFAIRRVVVRGRIVDLEEKPVQGATVALALAPGTKTKTTPVVPPPVVTDADGAYRFEHVPPDLSWRLRVRAPGFAYRRGPAFEAPRGEPTTVDPLVLARGWALEARLRRDNGTRVVGVRVRARPAAHATRPDDEAWVEGVTDENGVVVLRDLPPEDVRVIAGGDPWLWIEEIVGWPRTGTGRVWNGLLDLAPRVRGRVLLERGGDPEGLTIRALPSDGSPAHRLALEAGGFFETRGLPVVPVDLHVVRTGEAVGTSLAVYQGAIPDDATFVRILVPKLVAIGGKALDLDPEGPPAEVRLEAPRPEPEERFAKWRTVRKVVLPPGERHVPFRLEGVGPGPHALRLVQGHVDSGPIPLWVEGRDVEGLEVILPRGGAIAGTILDERPDPILGALVTLTRLRGDGDAPGGERDVWTKATGTDGSFSFVGLAPGLWRIRARHDDLADAARVVRIGEGETVVLDDLVLREGGSLSGTLRSESGRGFDGLELDLEALAEGIPVRSLRTRTDGSFLAENLAPGTWRVRVRSRSGPLTDFEALVEIVASERKEVDLVPGGRAVVEGRVTRRGLAVPNVTVRLVAVSSDIAEPLRRLVTRTDGGGHFFWGELPPGTYRLDVEDGVVRSTRSLRLRATDRLTMDLEVWAGRVGGHVRTAAGGVVAGALVEAHARGEGAPGFVAAVATTNPEGRFVFAGLPPGGYDLEASAPGLPPGRRVAVKARQSNVDEDVEIVLGRGGNVEIDVEDDTGRGVSGAQVWVETADGTPLHPRAFAVSWSGRLRIEGVPRGARWIRVEARGYGRPPRREVRVEESETVAIRFVLPPPARLEVIVTSAGPDPLPRARIDLRRDGEDVPWLVRERLQALRLAPGWGRIPRTGRLWIEDLEAGAYVLVIEAGPRFEPLALPIVMREGVDSRVEVQLVRREED